MMPEHVRLDAQHPAVPNGWKLTLALLVRIVTGSPKSMDWLSLCGSRLPCCPRDELKAEHWPGTSLPYTQFCKLTEGQDE
jgi:hypothetical protein